jgi:hypothetical protein
MDQNKVYIVTAGDYSDYYICGVFSSEEKAKVCVEDTPDGDYKIEEYSVDTMPKQIFRERYSVYIDVNGNEDGKGSCYVENITEIADEHLRGRSQFIKDYVSLKRPHPVTGFCGYSYESKDHAFKLAVECRQAWLRENGL